MVVSTEMGSDIMAFDLWVHPLEKKKKFQIEGIEGVCVLCYLQYISL